MGLLYVLMINNMVNSFIIQYSSSTGVVVIFIRLPIVDERFGYIGFTSYELS
jgi:hypothetical protein